MIPITPPKPLIPRKHRQRIFKPDEDLVMLRQSQGEFTMQVVERTLHASRDTIMRRMKELGLEPVISKQSYHPGEGGKKARGSNAGRPKASDAQDGAPNVGHDKLLQALVLHHGDRQES